MAWPHSEVVRAVSKNRLGPYKVAEVIGSGHNPEAYRLKDGRYVCYVMGAYYLGATITGPWERKQFRFDPRDRKIVANLPDSFKGGRRYDLTITTGLHLQYPTVFTATKVRIP